MGGNFHPRQNKNQKSIANKYHEGKLIYFERRNRNLKLIKRKLATYSLND